MQLFDHGSSSTGEIHRRSLIALGADISPHSAVQSALNEEYVQDLINHKTYLNGTPYFVLPISAHAPNQEVESGIVVGFQWAVERAKLSCKHDSALFQSMF